MGDSGTKNKVLIVAGLSSVLLLAAVIAAAVAFSKNGGTHHGGGGGGGDVSAASKAVELVCSPTDYKETCQQSLAGVTTTDPKKLIEAAFDAAIKNIGDVLKSSDKLKKAATDPSTKGAFDVCDEVLQSAVEDLKRSIDKVESFDATHAKEFIADLRTWMAAAGDDQETCTDAFENTTGDSGEKMKGLLKTAKEMSSNGLAMVSNISSIIGGLQLAKIGGSSGRKLLSAEDNAFVDRRILKAATMSLKPTMVVAKDGSGQFKSIKAALDTLPKKNNGTFIVVHIKAGVYDETVVIPKKVNKVLLIGDGIKKTIITGKASFAGGVKTYHTATVAVNSDDFFAKDLTIENTAGSEGHQAVALRVSGDKAVLYNVKIDGYQDTLYAHKYRQYYRGCSISGTIDFVFGDALALFQDCTFVVRKPGPNQACMVTAEGRIDPRSPGGFVIQNGHITAEPALLAVKPAVKAYLGRPWKELSRTIIMQSQIDGFIDPTGWAPWSGDFAIDTCYYAEYMNRGAGAGTKDRVTWKGIQKMTAEMAQKWTGAAAYGDDAWIKASGVPYVPTMMQV